MADCDLNNCVFYCTYSLFRSEYFLIEPETWMQIRGIVMVLIMKVISLVDDIEKFGVMPNFVQYCGYTLSGANIMFGPWISFSDYLNFSEKPTRKVSNHFNQFFFKKIGQFYELISCFRILLGLGPCSK